MQEKDDMYTIKKFFADFIVESMKAIIKLLEKGEVPKHHEIEEHTQNTKEWKNF